MRSGLITTALLMALSLFSPAYGQSNAQPRIAQDIVAEIQADGYAVSEVKRSWLGRIVITASNGSEIREVVVNRTSGEVLRDQIFPIGDEQTETQDISEDNPAPNTPNASSDVNGGPAGPAGAPNDGPGNGSSGGPSGGGGGGGSGGPGKGG